MTDHSSADRAKEENRGGVSKWSKWSDLERLTKPWHRQGQGGAYRRLSSRQGQGVPPTFQSAGVGQGVPPTFQSAGAGRGVPPTFQSAGVGQDDAGGVRHSECASHHPGMCPAVSRWENRQYAPPLAAHKCCEALLEIGMANLFRGWLVTGSEARRASNYPKENV